TAAEPPYSMSSGWATTQRTRLISRSSKSGSSVMTPGYVPDPGSARAGRRKLCGYHDGDRRKRMKADYEDQTVGGGRGSAESAARRVLGDRGQAPRGCRAAPAAGGHQG